MKIEIKNLKGEPQIILAYVAWGLLPIYWKLFSHYDSGIVIAHRLLWSVVICALVLAYRGQLKAATQILLNRKNFLPLLVSAILIAINWLSYIYALANDQALEAALAYFICPLLSVLFGALFLGEQIARRHIIPLLFIAVGVGIKIFETGAVPTMALIIGGSFSAYALNKKRIKVEATQGMFAETLLLAAPAALYLLFNSSSQDVSFTELALMSTTGAVTVIPLILFAAALGSVSMRFVGMAQYLAPTLMFLVAVFFYGQPFGVETLLSFIFIWSGIAFSAVGEMQTSLRRKLKLNTEPQLSNA